MNGNSNTIVIIGAIVGLIASGYIAKYLYNQTAATKEEIKTVDVQRPDYREKDEHGCTAGFLWCQAKKKCLKPEEEYCTSAAPKTLTYICEWGKQILATFYEGDNSRVDLVLSDKRRVSLPKAFMGMGTRYEKKDQSFIFISNSDKASYIQESGQVTYAECFLK